jgi:ribosomal protein S18 acetylase RimI-like enzyme
MANGKWRIAICNLLFAPPSMLTPTTLDIYMRRAAALTHQTVEMPPFELFFDPHDPLRFYNYARPVGPIGEAPSTGSGSGLDGALAALREAFETRHRLPRFEFIAEATPGLPAVLQAAGFVEEGRNPLLICTVESFRPAAAVPGLAVVTLTADSPVADLCAAGTVQARSFGAEDAPEMAEAEGERQRARLAAGAGTFLARLDGAPVAAADFTVPLDGFTELVGIATLPAYRRRGIASALTARAVQEAFARGVRVAFLGAEDERAGRVYERVGFRPFATALAYCAE